MYNAYEVEGLVLKYMEKVCDDIPYSIVKELREELSEEREIKQLANRLGIE